MDMGMISGTGSASAAVKIAGTSSSATAASSTTKAKDPNALGKDQFLQLLIAQMENQDPTEPMDNTAMVAQLAQFSALEQMQNLNTSFTTYQQETALMQSMLLTGKNVSLTMVDGTEITGVVDKVIHEKGLTYLQMGEETYSMQDISSMTVLTEETAAAMESTGGTPPQQSGETSPYVVG